MGSINGFSTAREILAAVDKREISALELLDLHLRRIERYDRQINAIVIRCGENARQAARLLTQHAPKALRSRCLAYP